MKELSLNILDIAEKLRADPGAHFDIGGGE